MKNSVIRNLILIFLLITLISPWFWKIILTNQLIGILLISLGIFLVNLTFNNKYRLTFLLATILFFAIISSFSFKEHFDQTIWSRTPEETSLLNQRHAYYSENLGNFYKNKIALYYFTNIYFPLSKFMQNLFYNLDINLYFFANHPRERTGIDEFEKYTPLLLPFFIIGVFYVLRMKLKIIGVYLLASTISSAFLKPSYSLGPTLFLPLISLIISLGIYDLVMKFKSLKN